MQTAYQFEGYGKCNIYIQNKRALIKNTGELRKTQYFWFEADNVTITRLDEKGKRKTKI